MGADAADKRRCAERKTSAAEVEPPQVRRASEADDQRSGLSWSLEVHIGANGHVVAVELCE